MPTKNWESSTERSVGGAHSAGTRFERRKKMRAAKVSVLVLAGALLMMRGEAVAAPMGTAFTYQGVLVKGGALVTDVCTFDFTL